MDKQKIRRLLMGELTVERLILLLAFIYAFVVLCAYLFSDRIIFQPQRSTYKDGPEILKIKTEDGTHISALHLPNNNAEFTILYSHGNAEDIGDIRPILEMFRGRGFSVLAYDYRGYGTSEARPSEKGAYLDVEAAYGYAVKELGINPNRIIALGRSVGGGAAVHLACRQQIAGLILEGSFVTAFRTVTRIALVPFDKFRNIDKIKKVHCPVLVIHGKDDEIIAFWHGRKLFEKANEPKLNLWVDGAGHNDLIWVAGSRYWDIISRFIDIIRADK